MFFNTMPRQVLAHHIKTSAYALATIVLAGWVTNALNEDLMFRMVTRFFFPQAVADYKHPFENATSAFIWGAPLFFGLLIMLVTCIMTVHHFKKKHVYAVSKPQKLSAIDNIILAPQPEYLEAAAASYPGAAHIHLVYTETAQADAFRNQAERLAEKGKQATVHFLAATTDLRKLADDLNKLIRRIYNNEKTESAFDVKHASPLLSSAATYCALEEDMRLAWPEAENIFAYDLEYVVDS